MRHALLVLFASAVLVGCSTDKDKVATQGELSKLGLSVARLQIAHGRIAGVISSDRYYHRVSLLVHIYDGEGVRVGERIVTVENLLPNEGVRIDADAELSVPVRHPRAEVKLATAE